jgi:hypothetical protein
MLAIAGSHGSPTSPPSLLPVPMGCLSDLPQCICISPNLAQNRTWLDVRHESVMRSDRENLKAASANNNLGIADIALRGSYPRRLFDRFTFDMLVTFARGVFISPIAAALQFADQVQLPCRQSPDATAQGDRS